MSQNIRTSYTLDRFRKEIRSKIEQIYQEEESLHSIYFERDEFQDIVEEYDENFSKPYLDIVEEEISKFKNNQDSYE